ncbi:hypothetical protein [Aliiroseovarius sp. 2305UL8-7]|uniref:hypothetical protein n=1 Tax=Aliiroseovarius conchicola TaxID=3121637 RepID=UPI0035273DD6
MKHAETNSASVDLLDLLDRERSLILSGDVEKITRLLPEKERLMADLNASVASAEMLEELQTRADHNQTLLSAVAQGIRAVQKRLEALQSARSELRTYTKAGQAMNLSAQQTSIEKKA